ncbi:unnamed protein product [Allacma fusca]|uniref:Uncharacterized protein n=1 Tax=Allacma fusca TaxID=39272 RepID=A0A8J2K7M6_9HEXA|nr:unnamed protein product [Allacma fusca]
MGDVQLLNITCFNYIVILIVTVAAIAPRVAFPTKALMSLQFFSIHIWQSLWRSQLIARAGNTGNVIIIQLLRCSMSGIYYGLASLMMHRTIYQPIQKHQ